MVPKTFALFFLKVIIMNIYSKLRSKSGALESQIKTYFLNILPSQNLWNFILYEFWYLYEMKAWLFYIRLTYPFFPDSLELLINQENIHPTLTLLRWSYPLISNVKLTLSSISNFLRFWSVNVIIISSKSLLYVYQKKQDAWFNI